MAFASHCGLNIKLPQAGEKGQVLASLFSEELGAVLQVKSEDLASVHKFAEELGLADCVHSLGVVSADDRIIVRNHSGVLLNESRVDLQRIWSETSYRIQALRDNDACAIEEYDSILDAEDPGLAVALTFDPDADTTAPFINRGVQPRVAVLREQGVNGQVEMAAAFHRARFNAVDLHMTDLASGQAHLKEFDLLVACGGFSYGDVLGAGGGWAKSILFNEQLRAQFEGFFQRDNTLTLGICNGCQMISLLHELIPGADGWPRFVRNRSEQFEARFIGVRVAESASVFLKGMSGSMFPIAVAHGEGCARFDQEEGHDSLLASGRVPLQYVDNRGQITARYPFNPNGSPVGIAGATSRDGRVTIMMPHPERVFRATQNSWHPDDWQEDAPALRLFRNGRSWFG
jgi:phosphoribosylformylglycinamidine synthase